MKLNLDPDYKPAFIANKAYLERLASCDDRVNLLIALERDSMQIKRFDIPVALSIYEENWDYIERHIKFALWSFGAWKITLFGPAKICSRIQVEFSKYGQRSLDLKIMKSIYASDLYFMIASSPVQVPRSTNFVVQELGGHLDACRIGFDLGASDYKLAALENGKLVFSEEIVWDPVSQSDFNYHYDRIMSGLELAASKLPRVDAIGGSSAGVYIQNRVRIASLFRAVPSLYFQLEVRDMFLKIAAHWQVPFTIINDGDVTALAGAMSLGKNKLMGIAMGSSMAVGYIDAQAGISGQLNELAFAPVDFNKDSVVDEWSQDYGLGVSYFSQQAVNRLASKAGIEFTAEMGLAERLKKVQSLADNNDARALEIFRTIAYYLAYTLAHYKDYYDIENVLLLGRVMSGTGGDLILATAKDLLRNELSFLNINLFVPDEKTRRVGQAVAAASLARIG